ncbi:MAG: ABC transporter permease [Oscillospiraceae bacterium]|nr:ABC transporter permease [Oscillospiraceae bacterium]
MKFVQSFKMAFKSILAKKGRAVLTMVSIFIGVAAVIIMVSLQQAQTDYWMEYMRNMGTNRIQVYASMWGGKDFTKQLYNFCLGMTDLVEGVTPSQTLWGAQARYGAKGMNANVYFGSEQYGVCTNSTVTDGRDLAYMDVEKMNRVCVVGSAVKDKLFDYQDPVGARITINNQSFTVVGVYKQKFDGSEYSEDNIILVPYSQNRLLARDTRMEQFVVKAKDAAATDKAIDRLKIYLMAMYRDRPYAGYDVYSLNQSIEEGNQQERQNMLMFGGIAAISLLVGGIGIMNIMLVTVTERTREIGVRKAIGAERRSIIAQFLIESSLVSALGGALGVVLGILGTLVWIKISQNKIFYPSPFIMLLAFGVSVALGVVFGLYPAAKASRLQPVDALRNE